MLSGEMALRQALLQALGCEDRTRAAEQRAAAAEQRAADAEARAAAAEQRWGEASAELHSLRMDRFQGRQTVLRHLEHIARGHVEVAIRGICYGADMYLSNEDPDDFTCIINVTGDIEENRFTVCTYWTVEMLKRILQERFGMPWGSMHIMHAGIVLVDSETLGSYHLFDVVHDDEPPLFVVSRR